MKKEKTIKPNKEIRFNTHSITFIVYNKNGVIKKQQNIPLRKGESVFEPYGFNEQGVIILDATRLIKNIGGGKFHIKPNPNYLKMKKQLNKAA